jgi:hypothetical protein
MREAHLKLLKCGMISLFSFHIFAANKRGLILLFDRLLTLCNPLILQFPRFVELHELYVACLSDFSVFYFGLSEKKKRFFFYSIHSFRNWRESTDLLACLFS